MSLENQDNSTEFVVESQEYLADIERQLLAIEAGGAHLDVDLVNTVFRAVHSIRGAAGFMGLTTIGELAHALEDALNLMRNRDLAPTREIIDTLLRAADALRGLIADVAQSNGADIAAHVAALQGMIEGNTAPAVQASLQQTVTVPTAAGVSLQLSAHALSVQQQLGRSLYVVECDLIGDVEAKGRTPLALVKDLLSVGDLLDSRLCWDDWGGLDQSVPETMRFVVLVATGLTDVGLVAEGCRIPSARVHPATGLSPAATPAAVAPHASTG
jgi:two-component system chemotaxis sensor kinase CheA